MKRILIIFSFVLFLLFGVASVAYLLRPLNISINSQDIKNAAEIKPALFINEKWGTTEAEFGIDKSGWLPGPMSLAVDSNDNLFVLDQVNKRVKKYSSEAKLEKIINIDSTTYEDIAVDNGFIYLLDPVENRKVEKINQSGVILETFYISEKIQPISSLILSENNVYVEVNHSVLYKLGTENEASSESKQLVNKINARPGDEFSTNTSVTQDGNVIADIKGHYPLDSLKIDGDLSISSLISVNTDRDDNLFILFSVVGGGNNYNKGIDSIIGLKVKPSGAIESKLFASNDYYTSHFRKFAVSPAGFIYQLRTTEDGVVISKW